jgi:Flp pilus assembly pilin Flp
MLNAANHAPAPAQGQPNGQTMTEYALILAAVAIVAVVAYTLLGTTITTLLNNVVACL